MLSLLVSDRSAALIGAHGLSFGEDVRTNGTPEFFHTGILRSIDSRHVERGKTKVIVMQSVPDRRQRSVVGCAAEIVTAKCTAFSSFAEAFRQATFIGGNIRDGPVSKRTRGCIWIFTDQREAACALWRA